MPLIKVCSDPGVSHCALPHVGLRCEVMAALDLELVPVKHCLLVNERLVLPVQVRYIAKGRLGSFAATQHHISRMAAVGGEADTQITEYCDSNGQLVAVICRFKIPEKCALERTN